MLSLAPPLSSSSIVLDNACGPGIVTGEIFKLPLSMQPEQIHAADFSPKMIQALKLKSRQPGLQGSQWQSVHTHILDAQDLGAFQDDMFTHSFMNFAVFMLPDPVKAACEIHRTLMPGKGTAVVTSWAELGYLYVFQNAQRSVRPDAPCFQGPISPEWMTETKLRSVLESGGFLSSNITITPLTAWLDMQEWSSGLKTVTSSLKSLMTRGWTEEERDQFSANLEQGFKDAMNDRAKMEAWVAVARK